MISGWDSRDAYFVLATVPVNVAGRMSDETFSVGGKWVEEVCNQVR